MVVIMYQKLGYMLTFLVILKQNPEYLLIPLQPSPHSTRAGFEIGVTLYSKAKACQPCYSDKKMREITKAMRRTIISAESDDDESDLIKQLKFKFKTTTEGGEQVTHSQCFARKLVVSSCKVYLESESAVRVMYTTAILPV